MSGEPYPNLRFNPVPGSTSDLTDIARQIDTAFEAVQETNQLLRRLRDNNDEAWKGDAGNAFRTTFDATLAQDLGYAQSSLERGLALIQQWHRKLVEFQGVAAELDAQAAVARGEHARALTQLADARSDPDLSPANMMFTSPAGLQESQSRLDRAVARVRIATTSVEECQAHIDAIIERARELRAVHHRLARRIAVDLDDAAEDFAPSPPDRGIFDTVTGAIAGIGDFIAEHRKQIHDILAGISQVTGLLTMLTVPPAGAVFGALALVSGAGALATDFADPKVRAAICDFTSDAMKLEFNGSALKTIGLGVGLDPLNVIPGASGIAKSAFPMLKGNFGEAVAKFTESSQAPGFLSRGLPHIQKLGIPGTVTTASALERISHASTYKPGEVLTGIEVFSRSVGAVIGAGGIAAVGIENG